MLKSSSNNSSDVRRQWTNNEYGQFWYLLSTTLQYSQYEGVRQDEVQDVICFTEQWRWTKSLMKNEAFGWTINLSLNFYLHRLNMKFANPTDNVLLWFSQFGFYACKLRRLCKILCTAVAMPRYKPLEVGDKRVMWMPYTLYCCEFTSSPEVRGLTSDISMILLLFP